MAPGARRAKPASYATSLAFEIARLNGRTPVEVATVLAAPLRRIPWIAAAEPAGDGYLTITVTPQALAASAARMAAAGPACGQSMILRGTAASVRPWPDLAAASNWPGAWKDQAETMTGRLAQAHAAQGSPSPPNGNGVSPRRGPLATGGRLCTPR